MSDIPVTREDRVRFIMRQMAADPPEWPEPGTPESPEHRRKLAEEWGCAEATIRDYAAEASRNLRADPSERDYLRFLVAKRFQRLSVDAETTANKQTGLPDWKSAISALELFAKFSGIDVEETQQPQRDAPRIVIEPPGDAPVVEPGADGDGDGKPDSS